MKKIDKQSIIPRYYQLKQILTDLIQSGGMKEGDKLPTERALVRDYGVSLNTVHRAFAELRNEGFLKRERGKGTFVTDRTNACRQTLRVFVVSPEWAVFIRSLIPLFESNYPGWKVELLIFGEPAYHTLKDIEDGRLIADVILTSEIEFRALAEKALLTNLTPFLKKEKSSLLDDIPSKIINLYDYIDNISGIPFVFSPLALFYNKDIFDKLGLKYPSADWNRADFLDAAKKLTSGNGRNISMYGFASSSNIRRWTVWSLLNGSNIFSDDGKRCLMDRPEVVEALQFFTDLFYRYGVSQMPGTLRQASQLFARGKAAMVIDGAYQLSLYKKISAFKWDIAPLPGVKSKVTPLLTTAGLIPKTCSHPWEAWNFIRFLLKGEIQNSFKKKGYGLPARISSVKKKISLDAGLTEKHFQTLHGQLKHASPVMVTSDFDFMQVIQNEMDMAFSGIVSTEQACKTICKKISQTDKEEVKKDEKERIVC
jgi:ABC-type glycerol-3-phosphate transport system substrate-binding protein